MTTIEKLQSLYKQLDQQASAGEDVVVDLRKEINNLELAYLKEDVLPRMAAMLSSKIKNLRCGIDCSIQFDKDGVINYSFCTTGSMLMVKNSVDAKSCIEPTYASSIAQAKPFEITVEEPISKVTISDLRIVDYSEKAIAVYGDTRHLADTFKTLGGYFNARLKEGPGWVFSKKRRDELENLLAQYLPNRSGSKTDNYSSENLFSSIGMEIPDLMTEEDWIKAVSNMKCMPNKGFIAPHKAIFILAIIESIRCGYLKDNRIYPTKRIEETYRILWSKYVPKNWPFTMNFFQPYAHMSSESFYDIVKVNERANFDINISWTNIKAARYIKHGVLDERLFNLLKNRQFAIRLTDVILRKYLSPLSRPSINRNMNTSKSEISDSYLSDFKKYLLTIKNKHGKPFAPSSINVYVGGLKNDYMQSMVIPYSADGLLESISSIQELIELSKKVKADASIRRISNSVYVGLKLYIDYRSAKSSASSEKADLSHTTETIEMVTPTEFEGFREYLQTQFSSKGKPYTPSAISLYASVLRSNYVRGVVSDYVLSEDIEDITDIGSLKEIYNIVDTKSKLGLTNPAYAVALKLYTEYRSLSPSSNTDSSDTSTRYKAQPSKSKPLEIVSITAEHIHITEGNPTSMIIQFINEIGPELVADMNINYLGGMLVSKTPNPKYISASKKLNDGYWLNTNSSTRTKIEQIKSICNNLGIEVSIVLGDNSNETATTDTSSTGKRAMYSLNGHNPLNKRQSVLACVRLFMALNPNVAYEVVERNFPPELQGSYGIVAKLAKVQSRISHGYDDDRRYFLDKDKILKAKDGVEFVVCHQWGTQFPKFQEHIRKRFGWTLEEVNNTDIEFYEGI